MFTNWRRFIFLCFLLTLTLIVGIVMRRSDRPEPPVTTTTTTTTIPIEWNEENLNILIEQISKEENFEDVFLLKELARIESQYLKYPEILERNGWWSRGLMHFRTSTFLEQGIKYGVIQEGTTTEEALILTYNPELQIRIVCRMGKENIRFIRQHWVNSYNKIYCD